MKYLRKFDLDSDEKKIALPIMNFIFEDVEICEDTFSVLMHYIHHYAQINLAEREKIKRTAMLVLKGLFEINHKQIELIDITTNENKMIKTVTDIENKIFEKIFAYLRPTTTTPNTAGTSNDKPNGKERGNDNEEEEGDEDHYQKDQQSGGG